MNNIKKADGFENQYLFVIPQSFIQRMLEDEVFHFLHVTDIGYFPHAYGHYRQRKNGCDTQIVLYCRTGCGYIEIGSQPIQALSAGQAVIIPSGTPHTYWADADDPWSLYWVHLQGSAVGAYLRATPRLLSPCTIAESSGDDLVRVFYEIFTLLKEPYDKEEYVLICQLCGSLVARMGCGAKHAELSLSDKGSVAVTLCINYMKHKLGDSLSLQELAVVTGFSASHLNTLFKRSTGHAPVAYFLRMKVQAASKEIFFTQRTIKEVAIDFGFDDPYYFSRLFKKITGMSPMAYRAQIKG